MNYVEPKHIECICVQQYTIILIGFPYYIKYVCCLQILFFEGEIAFLVLYHSFFSFMNKKQKSSGQ